MTVATSSTEGYCSRFRGAFQSIRPTYVTASDCYSSLRYARVELRRCGRILYQYCRVPRSYRLRRTSLYDHSVEIGAAAMRSDRSKVSGPVCITSPATKRSPIASLSHSR